MNKITRNTRLLPLLTSAALFALPLTHVQAQMQEGALEIWADKGNKKVEEIAAVFTEDTGIAVTVVRQGDPPGKFDIAAGVGKGPDIFFWAHDRYGDWGTGGLIQPVKPSQEILDSTLDYAWDAVTVDGRIYGYPIAIEAIGLIYNKDLISEPPESFEELFALQQSLQESKGINAILWDYNNTYFSWPLLAANGGYVFAKTDKGYDTADTGVNTEGAKIGARLLRKMIDEGLMAKHSDYSVMDMRFHKGEVAMVLNGPWYWDDLDKAGINYAVAPLPTVAGKPAKAFVGVYGATINGNTPNKDLAVEFIENYLLNEDNLQLYHTSGELGVSAHKGLKQEMMKDPRLAATYKSAELGEAMPNTHRMAKFWSAMGAVLSNITTGRQRPDPALDMAAKRIVR